MATQTADRAALLAATVLLAIAVFAACVRPATAALPTAPLPDDRAYEMVSPPSKNGSDIVPHSPKTFAAADGNGVAFVGLGPFGEVRGTATDVQYVGHRDGTPGTNGWSTHSVNPPGAGPPLLALIFSNASTFQAFTPDLTGGVYSSWKGLTDAPNVGGVLNLYQLRHLDAAESEAQLVSASAAPIQPPDPFTKLGVKSVFDGASTDLSHIIIQSPYNLTGDGSFSIDGDLYEYADGVGVRRVGRIPAGSASECDDSVVGSECVDAPNVQAGFGVSTAFGSSQYATGMISDDGSSILFQGPAGAPSGPIYMRKDGTRTYQINASEKNPADSPATAQLWGMSSDGSRVFFTTSESLILGDDDGGSSDLYMYDVTAPAGARLTLLSGDRTNAGFVTSVVGTSRDGHYVYFVSDGQLEPQAPSSTIQGLYLWHDGVIRYIGRFEDINLAALNTPATGWQGITGVKTSRVSPDGTHLLFMSTRDEGFRGQGGYQGYDHGICGSSGCRELYVYEADSGRLACVSCNPLVRVATGNALIDVSPGVSTSPVTQYLSHAISDDGQHVFFSTPEGLVEADGNRKWDAYEYDVPSGTVHLISTGTSSTDSYFMDASPDGSNVFFVTRQRLLGWDTDDNYDLYDARIRGGFPEPPTPSAPCTQDSCKPGATVPPSAAAGASAQFKGAGDQPGKLRARKRCKGRAVLKTVNGKRKCVKPRRHRRHHTRHQRTRHTRTAR